MIEFFLTTVGDYAFEIASLLVSATALVYASLALGAAKQAVQLAKDSDMTALRLKVDDEVSAAERSFHRFQENCNLVRRQWEHHISMHYPVLGRPLKQTQETKHISELERTGRTLLQALKDATPISADNNATEFESFVKHAKATAIQIDGLAFDLNAPKEIGH